MIRKTDSFMLPVVASGTEKGLYDIYPSFEVDGTIYNDLSTLVDSIVASSTVLLDGYEGVLWGHFLPLIVKEVEKLGHKVHAVDVSTAMKSSEEIDCLIEPFMGEADSIFGRMTDLKLIDFFDRTALAALMPDEDAEVNIIYGCGAFLSSWEGLRVYLDLPKNELQFRMAAGSAFNIGSSSLLDARDYYKRCYFIDWPILDEYKGKSIPVLDWIVDEQRVDEYTYMSGDTFRKGLSQMCRNSFRVRPWFAPGVWGGDYMRDHIQGLNRDVKNLAWSYELMALENGILFSHDHVLLEVSFSFLMSYGYREILGHCAEDFREDFPIRFDFLDTIHGDNLSIQCHPRPEYIRSQFGKKYTQDETYYILKGEPDANVYLGFQEGVKKEEFKKALVESQEKAEKIDITRFVQSFPAKKHDLFLIPNGTIHASGSGNLVLEISSAPYIFTFKMYDWVRLDIDGRPRPINIKHGLNNVRFERNGDVVKETLLSRPYVMEQTEEYIHEHVPTHPDHFYDVERYTIHDGCSIDIQNENKCHVWMIVEGKNIELSVKNGRTENYNYLETFILPAYAREYSLKNTSGADVMLVKAFVKDNYTL